MSGRASEPAPGDGARRKSALLAHVRHELRTPLNAVIGYGEMLQEEAEERALPEWSTALEGVTGSGRRLLAMVNDRLDAGRLGPHAEVDLGELGSGLRREMEAPMAQLAGCCEALLGRAEASLPEFVPELERIRGALRKLQALVEEAEHLAGSAAGEGAGFEVSELAREVVATVPRLPAEPSAAPASPPPTLLVVDDTETNRDLLARTLTRQGYRVELAEDGIRALEAIRAREYDLILLDLMMPGLNGYQVLQRLKSDEELRHLPVIMISALDELDSVVACIEAGADDYLPKPFNPTLLQARIGASLEKKRLRDREQAHLRELRRFNEALEQRVEAAAGEIRRANAQLERRLREVTAMIQISSAIISTLDVDRVLEEIMELSKEVVTAEASSLLLLDRDLGKLRFHVARGSAGETLKTATVELGQGIAGWVAQTGESLLIPDAYQDPRFNPAFDRKTGFRTRSILTVPIRTKGELFGVVQVINKVGHDAFDEDDLAVFQSFADQAGIALENARLFAQTKQMADDLRRALEAERRLAIEKEKMGAFIPRQLVDEISRSREQTLALGGKLVTATILFSDIRGFTRFAETLEPQRVVGFLNEYMTAMSAVIDEEGGILDKFIGDGIMAVFTDDERHPDSHALRAVRTGIRMQQRMSELKRGWSTHRPEAADMGMRVGVNTGEVVAGNIGSATRMDYTVIGDNVNLASRIESNGRGGEVLMNETTYALVRDRFPAERLEPFLVKNRVRPVQAYSIRVRPDDAPEERGPGAAAEA